MGVDKMKTFWTPLPSFPSHRGEGIFLEEYIKSIIDSLGKGSRK